MHVCWVKFCPILGKMHALWMNFKATLGKIYTVFGILLPNKHACSPFIQYWVNFYSILFRVYRE